MVFISSASRRIRELNLHGNHLFHRYRQVLCVRALPTGKREREGWRTGTWVTLRDKILLYLQVVDFWNLPSLPCLQGVQQLHAHRACHQVPGVQQHQQIQQHQALPRNRWWFIFKKNFLQKTHQYMIHILIFQDSFFLRSLTLPPSAPGAPAGPRAPIGPWGPAAPAAPGLPRSPWRITQRESVV